MAAEFVKPFDCKNEAHVMWFKSLGETMVKSLNGDKKINRLRLLMKILYQVNHM